MDEDEIPTLSEVDLIAAHIAPQYRLAVYLQSGTGQRPSEALAFSVECRRSGFVRVRWQVSAKAHRDDCRTVFVPLKHRAEGEYRDIPTAPFIDQQIDAHLSRWEPVPVVFTNRRGKQRRLEVFFAPRQRGKGTMPTVSTYDYHYRKACRSAGLVNADGKAKYTPRSLRHLFASTALAHGVPIHEVSRWLGHRSVKTTIDIYGHLLPSAWTAAVRSSRRPCGPRQVRHWPWAPSSALTCLNRADSVLTWISQEPVFAGGSVVSDVPLQRVVGDITHEHDRRSGTSRSGGVRPTGAWPLLQPRGAVWCLKGMGRPDEEPR